MTRFTISAAEPTGPWAWSSAGTGSTSHALSLGLCPVPGLEEALPALSAANGKGCAVTYQSEHTFDHYFV